VSIATTTAGIHCRFYRIVGLPSRKETTLQTHTTEDGKLKDHRSKAQIWADLVTEFCGSWSFVIVSTLIIFVWVLLNTCLFLFGVFDPYPYIALNLLLTVVSTLQGPLIMMSQNRQADRDREAVIEVTTKLDDANSKLDSVMKTIAQMNQNLSGS
jgi:uncharacterized membrane protein